MRIKQTMVGRIESSFEGMDIPFFLQYSHLTGLGSSVHSLTFLDFLYLILFFFISFFSSSDEEEELEVREDPSFFFFLSFF